MTYDHKQLQAQLELSPLRREISMDVESMMPNVNLWCALIGDDHAYKHMGGDRVTDLIILASEVLVEHETR